MILQFTEKGMELNRQIEEAFNEWLQGSDLTRDGLLEYKDVKKFHIAEENEGFALAYYENGEEKYIGAGVCRECYDTMVWVFAYACALLDSSISKPKFGKELRKWGKQYEKKQKRG